MSLEEIQSEQFLFYKDKDFTLYKGKMQDVLSTFEENSIDSIVCDPPYELNFMSKGWDNQGIAFLKDTWEHCFRVLKEGGYLLAFGGTRTFHRIACAIEDAGFEIRDTIIWLYGSGFPKSMNIGLAIDKKKGVDNRTGNVVKGVGSNNTNSMKNGLGKSQEFAKEYEERIAQNEWKGWGTTLKPAYEPIIVARKPFKGSLVDNILQNGVGGLNIDECRVGNEHFEIKNGDYDNNQNQRCFGNIKRTQKEYYGRFPSNVITDGSEEVAQGMPFTNGGSKIITNKEVNGKGLTSENPVFNSNNCGFKTNIKNDSISSYGDNGSAMRYFYCAKANSKDRDEGLDDFESVKINLTQNGCNRKENGKSILENPNISKKNVHPTVKPVELMQYLVRLVSPKGAKVLDCFMGSGSTGKACMFENRERNANYHFIGIEMTDEYLPIAKTRIDYAKYKYQCDEIKEKEERKEKGIINIFDILEEWN